MRPLTKLLSAGSLLIAMAAVGQTNERASVNPSTGQAAIPEKLRTLPEAPSATRDNQGFLVPGADPENRLLVPFLKHLASDQKQFWSSPTHLDKTGAATFAGFLGFTGLLIGSDSWITKQVPDKPDQLKRSQNMSNYAVYSLVGAGGGAYLLGKIRNDDHMSETGLLSGEAALNSTALTYFFKAITQRPRPLQDNGKGTLFHGGYSFPSEHSAVAWSIASVLAHEYPGPLTKFLAYGLASTVTLTRVTGKQHFATDAFVGSALGWYLGRQIYRAHHETELGGAPWGELVEAREKWPRNPANMGSPYVPLDSWVYPAFERLAALGYVQSAFLGMRPWTRMDCARLLEEADERMQPEGGESEQAHKIREALTEEFGIETARLNGEANLGVSLDSIYTRFMGISGMPLRDGYHFGQTIVNDYGRPYGEGFNNATGFTTHATAGPFTFYLRGEYQHAPSLPAFPAQALQVIQTVDRVPAPPGTVVPAVNRMDFLEGYVGVQLRDWQFTFGKQGLWWGPDTGGPMLSSTNAEPITMLRLSRVKPFSLPSIFASLGPMRFEYILGRMTGQHWVFRSNADIGSWTEPLGDQPFITGQKVSFKPSPNLELGIGATALFSGAGVPFTVHTLLRAAFASGNGVAGSAADPGDRRGEFDFAYRIPKLRDWLTFYGDAFTEDQANPWFAWDKTALTSGLYLSHVPRIRRLDFRVEGVFTNLPGAPPVIKQQPGFFYYNLAYRSGYTNNGNLIGSWIGRQGQGAEAWTNYWFGAKNKLQLHFRHQKVDQQFVPSGGTLTEFAVATDFWVRSAVSISSFVQYDRWAFPLLAPAPRTNVTGSVQITFWPHWGKP